MKVQKFKVTDQNIQVVEPLSLVSDSRNQIIFQFEFSKEWAGIQKTAIITTGGVPYHSIIQANGEILASNMPVLAPNYCTVSVFGGDLHTANSCRLFIEPSGLKDGMPPASPPPNIYNQILTAVAGAETKSTNAEKLAGDDQNAAKTNAKTATEAATQAVLSSKEALTSATNAKTSETAADASEAEALLSQQKAQQALADLLKIIGVDIATLVGGKIPMGQIPATATQEIYTVTSESELVGLVAQRGDLAELIETVNGVRTITKTWQLLGTSTVAADWVVWGTAYAVSAGNASTAANADNASMINNHRMVEMKQADFDVAVKDPTTYYLVTV